MPSEALSDEESLGGTYVFADATFGVSYLIHSTR
jgi:hypothetical protein